jgi:hypothetical protein
MNSAMHSAAASGATIPTRWTRFTRRCVSYQFYRFCAINLRMLRVIFRSHG